MTDILPIPYASGNPTNDRVWAKYADEYCDAISEESQNGILARFKSDLTQRLWEMNPAYEQSKAYFDELERIARKAAEERAAQRGARK